MLFFPAHLRPARLVGVLAALLLTTALPLAADLSVLGFVGARGAAVEGPPSWLAGDFGRLALSGGGRDEHETHALGQVQLALEWEPSLRIDAYVHLVARAEPGELGGEALGLAEGYLEGRLFPGQRQRLRLRLGQFFHPSSRENVEALWSSPYTLTLSALNTWLAEELRPVGLDIDQRWTLASEDEWSLGATVFGGNDSLGALAAWRGWTLSDRVTTSGEVVPLPPVRSLVPGGNLAQQRDDGSQPIGEDLDGRAGWAARATWRRPARALVQGSWIDNRGDRAFHSGEYAWRTRFWMVGGEWEPGRYVRLLGEAASGETGMGFAPSPRVQMDFDVGYLMASVGGARTRFSLRYDRFRSRERDFSDAEINDDDGEAWTAALLWWARQRLRLGFEVLALDADRPAAAEVGADPDTDALAAIIEVRFAF